MNIVGLNDYIRKVTCFGLRLGIFLSLMLTNEYHAQRDDRSYERKVSSIRSSENSHRALNRDFAAGGFVIQYGQLDVNHRHSLGSKLNKSKIVSPELGKTEDENVSNTSHGSTSQHQRSTEKRTNRSFSILKTVRKLKLSISDSKRTSGKEQLLSEAFSGVKRSGGDGFNPSDEPNGREMIGANESVSKDSTIQIKDGIKEDALLLGMSRIRNRRMAPKKQRVRRRSRDDLTDEQRLRTDSGTLTRADEESFVSSGNSSTTGTSNATELSGVSDLNESAVTSLNISWQNPLVVMATDDEEFDDSLFLANRTTNYGKDARNLDPVRYRWNLPYPPKALPPLEDNYLTIPEEVEQSTETDTADSDPTADLASMNKELEEGEIKLKAMREEVVLLEKVLQEMEEEDSVFATDNPDDVTNRTPMDDDYLARAAGIQNAKVIVGDADDVWSAPPYMVSQSLWSDWSSCSETCGPGLRNRTRICLQQGPPDFLCHGGKLQYQPCKDSKPCPTGLYQSLHIGQWTAWSPCSESCGPGLVTRRRNCTSKAEEDCAEISRIESVNCILTACRLDYFEPMVFAYEGQSAVLHCGHYYSNDGVKDINWITPNRDKLGVGTDYDRVRVNGGELRLKNVSSSMQGTYYCTVFRPDGRIETSDVLLVVQNCTELSPCQNGGICTINDTEASNLPERRRQTAGMGLMPVCICLAGFSGPICQYSDKDTSKRNQAVIAILIVLVVLLLCGGFALWYWAVYRAKRPPGYDHLQDSKDEQPPDYEALPGPDVEDVMSFDGIPIDQSEDEDNISEISGERFRHRDIGDRVSLIPALREDFPAIKSTTRMMHAEPDDGYVLDPSYGDLSAKPDQDEPEKPESSHVHEVPKSEEPAEPETERLISFESEDLLKHQRPSLSAFADNPLANENKRLQPLPTKLQAPSETGLTKPEVPQKPVWLPLPAKPDFAQNPSVTKFEQKVYAMLWPDINKPDVAQKPSLISASIQKPSIPTSPILPSKHDLKLKSEDSVFTVSPQPAKPDLAQQPSLLRLQHDYPLDFSLPKPRVNAESELARPDAFLKPSVTSFQTELAKPDPHLQPSLLNLKPVSNQRMVKYDVPLPFSKQQRMTEIAFMQKRPMQMESTVTCKDNFYLNEAFDCRNIVPDICYQRPTAVKMAHFAENEECGSHKRCTNQKEDKFILDSCRLSNRRRRKLESALYDSENELLQEDIKRIRCSWNENKQLSREQLRGYDFNRSKELSRLKRFAEAEQRSDNNIISFHGSDLLFEAQKENFLFSCEQDNGNFWRESTNRPAQLPSQVWLKDKVYGKRQMIEKVPSADHSSKQQSINRQNLLARLSFFNSGDFKTCATHDDIIFQGEIGGGLDYANTSLNINYQPSGGKPTQNAYNARQYQFTRLPNEPFRVGVPCTSQQSSYEGDNNTAFQSKHMPNKFSSNDAANWRHREMFCDRNETDEQVENISFFQNLKEEYLQNRKTEPVVAPLSGNRKQIAQHFGCSTNLEESNEPIDMRGKMMGRSDKAPGERPRKDLSKLVSEKMARKEFAGKHQDNKCNSEKVIKTRLSHKNQFANVGIPCDDGDEAMIQEIKKSDASQISTSRKPSVAKHDDKHSSKEVVVSGNGALIPSSKVFDENYETQTSSTQHELDEYDFYYEEVIHSEFEETDDEVDAKEKETFFRTATGSSKTPFHQNMYTAQSSQADSAEIPGGIKNILRDMTTTNKKILPITYRKLSDTTVLPSPEATFQSTEEPAKRPIQQQPSMDKKKLPAKSRKPSDISTQKLNESTSSGTESTREKLPKHKSIKKTVQIADLPDDEPFQHRSSVDKKKLPKTGRNVPDNLTSPFSERLLQGSEDTEEKPIRHRSSVNKKKVTIAGRNLSDK